MNIFWAIDVLKKLCGTNEIDSTLQILISESDKQRKHIKTGDKNQ